MADDQLDEYVKNLVAQWPPMSDEQINHVVDVLSAQKSGGGA